VISERLVALASSGAPSSAFTLEPSGDRESGCVRHLQRGTRVQFRRWERLEPPQHRGGRASSVEWSASAWHQACCAIDFVCGRSVLERLGLQPVGLVPDAGTGVVS
jgi:hypothetical protein